ncbi:hypothetical protein [Mycolicibacterium brisbanense]|uniref:hypothetical protein n=1 Tax=Mycolicibacterium brisbanense TaxID=146020 RepID=UPI0010423274|nr:hypothetical protein [Mycolicibacterium brisbanense]MCV7158692.1 hypothetical protein [Mycolicibacterium brisbanense]
MRAPIPDAGATLAAAMLPRVDELAQVLVDRIRDNIEVYRSDDVVPPDDLYTSCRTNLEFMIRHVAHEPWLDLDAPRQTGRRRAEQGVPLAMVQTAFRHSFACMWEMIVTEAARTDTGHRR